jgi:hypothetical protein
VLQTLCSVRPLISFFNPGIRKRFRINLLESSEDREISRLVYIRNDPQICYPTGMYEHYYSLIAVILSAISQECNMFYLIFNLFMHVLLIEIA